MSIRIRVIGILHNYNIMKSSYYKNFKYIGYVLSYYIDVINLDVVSFFSDFSKFDFVC